MTTTGDPTATYDPAAWGELAGHLRALHDLAQPRHAQRSGLRLTYREINDLVTMIAEAAQSIEHLVDVSLPFLHEQPEHDHEGNVGAGPIRHELNRILFTLGGLYAMARMAKQRVEELDEPE